MTLRTSPVPQSTEVTTRPLAPYFDVTSMVVRPFVVDGVPVLLWAPPSAANTGSFDRRVRNIAIASSRRLIGVGLKGLEADSNSPSGARCSPL